MCAAPTHDGNVHKASPPVLEFQLLAYFTSRPGRALARNVILNAVWGNSVFVTPRSIDRCVATLRAKIESNPHNPTYIQTIRDIGYRFEPEV